VAVSNVPGPRQKLETEEAVLESLYSVGPLQEGNGLNITVWSYCEQLNFSVICCARRVQDPQRIAAAIKDELERLKVTADEA
jgi:diacylglycerol O-acyltransferase